jgi:hypothetical protein
LVLHLYFSKNQIIVMISCFVVMIQPQNFAWTIILHASMSLTLWNLVWNWICVYRFMLNVLYVLDKLWVLIHFNLRFMKKMCFCLVWSVFIHLGPYFFVCGPSPPTPAHMVGLTYKTLRPCLTRPSCSRKKKTIFLIMCLANTPLALNIHFSP